MDEVFFIVLGLGLVGALLFALVNGISAPFRIRTLTKRISRLEGRLRVLELDAVARPRSPEPLPRAVDAEVERSAESEAEPELVFGGEADETRVALAATAAKMPPPIPPQVSSVTPPPTPPEKESLEFKVGAKWIGWVAVLMILIGVAFGLKYVSDQIGPLGRLALGGLVGMTALGAGEYYRRKHWDVIFQTLTGGGIGIFYVCVFFSFRFYDLSGAGTSFALAILVTLLGIVMSVAHNAMPIAVLSVIGGFLSPVLFSEGGDHPYILFTYIVILNSVALGAAYYRRWRVLDILCFAGTVAMYEGWAFDKYDGTQMLPALLYTSIFYLMFLLIPTAYGLSRKKELTTESLTLIIINALHSLFAFYNILYKDYRYAMGFVVIAQALLIFLLFRSWTARVSEKDRTGESLLIITLALVTLAIPIQLRLYGLPIGWSVEGALVIYLGIRFEKRICRLGGVIALFLAAGALLLRLPLHKLDFMVLFNIPFGSWCVTIIAIFIAATLLYKRAPDDDTESMALAGIVFALGYILSCILLTLEVSAYWTIPRLDDFRTYQFDSLALLWSVITVATIETVSRRNLPKPALFLAWGAYIVAFMVFVAGLDEYGSHSLLLALNVSFVLRLLLLAASWRGAHLSRKLSGTSEGNILEIGGHALLAILIAFEFNRWEGANEGISQALALALLSATWAAQAFGLIWMGLARREFALRIAGLVLFAITIAKIIIVDTGEMGPGFRVISIVGSGMLLLAAAVFYQRFSALFLEQEEAANDPPSS